MAPLTPAGLARALPNPRIGARLWVAYSGGLDSTVLLHALAEVRQLRTLDLAAIHIDHGLNPASADWAEQCRLVCSGLGIPLVLRRLDLRRRAGESLEALAREGRYAMLREIAGPDDLVLSAQHRDDQAETLLLALLRGSGLKGLAAMPRISPLGRAWLVRPLLDYGRADLLAYARARGLSWVEDPSNGDQGFDRNFLRARVLPVLAERWPACAHSLSRAAAHCAEAQGLIEGLAAAEIAHLGGSRPGTLSLTALGARDPALQAAVLRHWIRGLGLPVPDRRHLGRIRDELPGARQDRRPLVAWPGAEARRYRDDLYVMAPLPAQPASVRLGWRRGELALSPGLGRLRLLSARTGWEQDPETRWPGGLEVGFAGEGQHCQPWGQAHHRRLKHLFQEAGIPPWLRPLVPRLYAEGRLVAVGDLWRCNLAEKGAAGEGTAEGPDWRISWQGGIREHPGFSQPGHASIAAPTSSRRRP